jgi:hypothetical protein
MHFFTDHPYAGGYTYFEHLKRASYLGSKCIYAGCILFIHGIFPFLFEHTGSDTIKKLNAEINK